MIAEIGRTRIKLCFSFVATVTLMLYFCNERVVLSSFCASLFHESGHLAFMHHFGVSPRFIELGAFGIRIDRPENNLLSYNKESLIALGGIIFNLFAAAVFFIFHSLSEREIFLLITVVNILVAAVNSLPSSYLDAGRALYFTLIHFKGEEKAEKWVNILSAVFAASFTLFWLFYSLFIGINISLGAVALYLVITTFKRKVDK